MAEHRILFVQFVDTPGDLLLADTDFLRQRALGCVILREKFVQWWIKQPDRGRETFERAKNALAQWRHYEMGWVELFPSAASIEPGTNVAVLVRHMGFWSLNGCRVVYGVGDRHAGSSFGFAYGTLTNHAELGEEIFEVRLEPESEAVIYRIQAVSRPHAAMAWIGYPIARYFQERFRLDSTRALQRSIDVLA